MKILYTLALLVFSLLVSAGEYTFERITSKDGLSQNNVLTIFQCSEGYLWFATYDGLNRYDGYEFKVYRNSPENPNSLSSNLLLGITEDTSNNLWIGTFNGGVCRFNKTTEEVTVYKNTEDTPDLLANNNVSEVFCDSKNNLWLSSPSDLTYLKLKDDTINKSVKIRMSDCPNSKENSRVINVFEDSKGRIFLMTNVGLCLLMKNKDGDVENNIYHFEGDEIYIDLQNMKETKEGHLFTHRNGVSLLKFRGDNLEGYEIIKVADKFNRYLEIDRRGDLWLGGFLGLFKYKYAPDAEIPYVFEKHFVEGEGEDFLSNPVIRSMAIDDAGILWIGTNGGGIMKCNTNKTKFHHYKRTNQKGSISANKVWNIFEDSNHNLWFGTEGGGLNFLSVENRKDYEKGFKEYKVNPEGSANFAYQMIEYTEKGTSGFLVGVDFPNTLVKIMPNKKDWQVSPVIPVMPKHVMLLCKGNNNDFWIGTYNGGLFRSISKHPVDSMLHFTLNNSSLPSNIIRSISKDSKGRLWIGTDLGLAILTAEETVKEHPVFAVHKYIIGDSSSISHNYIVPVIETSNGEIWIGTFGGGLNRYVEGSTETNGSFIRYGIKQGLPSNTIKQIIEDDLGNLWVTSNMGLTRIDKSRKNIRNYTIYDGLQDVEFTDLSGIKLSDGQILIGGINGFNAFYPQEIVDDSITPRIVFNELEVMNRSIGINEEFDGKILLNRALNYTDKLVLKHSQHNFRISFAGLHYTVPKGNQFKYMLEGFDANWVKTTSKERFAKYTSIPAGTYTFKLHASNYHGLWTEKPKEIIIIVKPPYWRTWWFITVLGLFVLGLTIFIFYWRTRVIRQHNIELEWEVNERTLELENNNIVLSEQSEQLLKQKEELLVQRDNLSGANKQLNERQRKIKIQRDKLTKVNSVKDRLFSIVAHDLLNPFGALIGFLNLLRDKYEEFSEEQRKFMLDQMSSATNSIEVLLDNLLNWARSQQGAIRFKPEERNIIALLESNIKLVSRQADEKNIKIKMQYSSDEIVLNLDPNLMNTVIRNLLTNAVKYTQSEGVINVICLEEDKKLSLKIKDNGVGISKEDQKKLFQQEIHFSTYGTNNEKGTGLGLITAKDFVEMHEGKISVESEKEKGTTFTINLPLKNRN